MKRFQARAFLLIAALLLIIGLVAPIGANAQSAFLDFPLQGKTPYTIDIISVMDHSGTPLDSVTPGDWYSKDNKVTAYTGETAAIGFGANCAPSGYKNSGGTNFIVNGHYVGAACSGDSTDPRLYLNYDGHSGYDYRASYQTTIYASADGILKKAVIDNVNFKTKAQLLVTQCMGSLACILYRSREWL